ncbi:thioesterase domain protein [Mycobacterium xenopi 4042]|uniref:Thioesterase domain protein n=1 Tax=Mycobacterium xenopi 4042 TaxID=1299334 RepID=X8DK11_MYCXE|nr:thioesterase domain protein [Mycobacterium xenopi 4042]
MAEKVREHLEAGQVDGFVRTLRARPEGSSRVPVFVFHPAGGSTVVYEPLLNRLPADTPMYGFERVEGSIEERAMRYVPRLVQMQGDGPFVLAGWSLGGALAYACAVGLKRLGCDVPFVGLIDTVRPGEEIPQTKEEIRKRWDRYARFAERNFNVTIPEIPYEQLEQLDDEGQVRFVLDAVKASGVQIPGGIIEHQRTSYLDNRPWTPCRSSRTTATSRCTWPTATTMTRSCSSRGTPFASPTAAGASTCPIWRSCTSAASTSKPSTSRTSRR